MALKIQGLEPEGDDAAFDFEESLAPGDPLAEVEHVAAEEPWRASDVLGDPVSTEKAAWGRSAVGLARVALDLRESQERVAGVLARLETLADRVDELARWRRVASSVAAALAGVVLTAALLLCVPQVRSGLAWVLLGEKDRVLLEVGRELLLQDERSGGGQSG